MLRAAVAAGTPVGLRRPKTSWRAAGSFPTRSWSPSCPIGSTQPDAKNGFMLDGFPARWRRRRRSIAMLADKGLKLDAVIELKVDEGILLERIETRIAQIKARGRDAAANDNPETFKKRLGRLSGADRPPDRLLRDRRGAAGGRRNGVDRASRRRHRPGAARAGRQESGRQEATRAAKRAAEPTPRQGRGSRPAEGRQGAKARLGGGQGCCQRKPLGVAAARQSPRIGRPAGLPAANLPRAKAIASGG